jgi:hypothetical protein
MTTDIKTNFDFITLPKNDEGKYYCERCQTEFNDPSEVCWAEVGDFAKDVGIPLCAECCEDQIENWSEINDDEEEEEEEDAWTEAKKQMEEMAVRIGLPEEAKVRAFAMMTEIQEKWNAEEDEGKANELLVTTMREMMEAKIVEIATKSKQANEVIAFLMKENTQLKERVKYLAARAADAVLLLEDEESEESEESEDEESEDEN